MADNNKTKQLEKQKQLIIDYKHVFGSEAGQRVLHDMMQNHFMFRSTHHERPTITAYNEGMRNVILRILANINFKVQRFDELIKQEDKASEYDE